MSDDSELLRRYAEARSQDAFAELVQRHLTLVYSTALRQAGGDAHLAQDVTQMVFTDLARKAAALARRPVLAGWLHTSTRFAAAKVVRTALENAASAAIMFLTIEAVICEKPKDKNCSCGGHDEIGN